MGDFAGSLASNGNTNDILMGTDGKRRVIVNSIGKEVGPCPPRNPFPAADSADHRLRPATDGGAIFRAAPGRVVALDPRTGEVWPWRAIPPGPERLRRAHSRRRMEKSNEDRQKRC